MDAAASSDKDYSHVRDFHFSLGFFFPSSSSFKLPSVAVSPIDVCYERLQRQRRRIRTDFMWNGSRD